MENKYPYSPTLKLFYLGEQDAMPDDVIFLTHEEALALSANQSQSGGVDPAIDAARRDAYIAEVDPLMAEAAIKRAMGLDAEADTLTARAIAARQEIQARYSKS